MASNNLNILSGLEPPPKAAITVDDFQAFFKGDDRFIRYQRYGAVEINPSKNVVCNSKRGDFSAIHIAIEEKITGEKGCVVPADTRLMRLYTGQENIEALPLKFNYR